MNEALRAGRAAWPKIALSDETFLQWISGRDLTHPADLFLACGCARGERHALAALKNQVLPAVLERARVPASQRDELMALVLERLLVPNRGQLPRIEQYAGKGPLPAWLRMIVSRAAIDLSRGSAPVEGLEGQRVLAPKSTDPELQLLRRRYASQLSEAFRAVLVSLPLREGNVLQLHFLEGLSAAAIGAMYRVHGRTVQRWILDARESIVAQVYQRLKAELGLTQSQLDSLLTELHSQVDVSIVRLLPGSKRR